MTEMIPVNVSRGSLNYTSHDSTSCMPYDDADPKTASPCRLSSAPFSSGATALNQILVA